MPGKKHRFNKRVFDICGNLNNVATHFSNIVVTIATVGEGGHVRIGKVQHTLAKAVHALGCLYLVIILSNYSRFIMLVKKLQFPP